MASLFPIFLKLEGRRVLVVGAGTIAEQKLAGLLSAGASIHVVAPGAKRAFLKLAAEGRLRWYEREYLPSDLDGAVVVIAATGNPEVNERIYRDAESCNILCNAVDEPDRCHFYYPAVVQRGDLQIAISTAGHSPALAQRLRKELEQRFGPEYAAWIRQLGEARREMFASEMDPGARRERLHEIAAGTP